MRYYQLIFKLKEYFPNFFTSLVSLYIHPAFFSSVLFWRAPFWLALFCLAPNCLALFCFEYQYSFVLRFFDSTLTLAAFVLRAYVANPINCYQI